jgi:hypothetical protein
MVRVKVLALGQAGGESPLLVCYWHRFILVVIIIIIYYYYYHNARTMVGDTGLCVG